MARFVARWRTEYAVATLLIYVFIVLPITVLVFPDNSLWLALLIVVGMILDALGDVADQLNDEGEKP